MGFEEIGGIRVTVGGCWTETGGFRCGGKGFGF